VHATYAVHLVSNLCIDAAIRLEFLCSREWDCQIANIELKGVYRSLVEQEEETSWLLGLVAFAVFEERRIEWMQHFEEQNKKVPTADEIQNWYEQQPDGALLRAKGDAEGVLQVYAQDVEEEILVSHRGVIESEVIVSEIRSLKRPWAEFGINVGAGFVSAFLFAAILTAFAFIVFADTSPVDLRKFIGNNESETIQNGKKINK
jgi:hypothetical protein